MLRRRVRLKSFQQLGLYKPLTDASIVSNNQEHGLEDHYFK
jgi:hypothetical protein